jgi:transcriptional regulator with XRE-family HTH domain
MASSTASIIGLNIRKHREARGMTREQLAEAIDLDTGYLGMCERGERQLGLNKIMDVIRYFGITPNDILPTDTGHKPRPEHIKAISARIKDMPDARLVALIRIIDAMDTL